MKDGDQIPSDQILIMRNVDITGCTLQTTEGDQVGALVQIRAGSLSAGKTYQFFVSFPSMLALGQRLVQSARTGLERTTPRDRKKH